MLSSTMTESVANGKERTAMRRAYQYAQTLSAGLADMFPNGANVNIREEIHWIAEEVTNSPEEAVELLPNIVVAFRQGVLDLLFQGEDRYLL